MRAVRTATISLLAVTMLGGASVVQPVSADTAPAVSASTPGSVTAGSPIPISGTMTATAQPGATLWNDGSLAQDIPALDYPSDPMLDLVQGSVEHALPADPLTVKVKVAAGPETPPRPYQRYRWPFQLEDIWYFVLFTYVQNGASGGWQGSWYYCKLALGSNCIHGETPPFPVTWDAAARTFTGRIPMRDLARVQPDGTLGQDEMRPFDPQYRPESAYALPAITVGQDRGPVFTPHVLPIATVRMGIAAAGTSADQVTFNRSAVPSVAEGSLDVGFTGSVPTAGLAPGSYSVFVKGCYGPCTVQEIPVSIT